MVRKDPTFQKTVFQNNLFNVNQENSARRKIFQRNVYQNNAFSTEFVFPPVFQNKVFQQNAFQGSWALSDTVATESVGITEALPNSVRGIVRTATLEIVGIVEGSLFSRGKYRFIGENIASSESIGRARDVARSIAESVAISQFDGRIRD